MRVDVWSCPAVPGPQHGDAIAPVVALEVARRRCRAHWVGSDFYSGLRILEVARTARDIDEQIAAADSDATHLTVTAFQVHVVRYNVDIHPWCCVDELGGPEGIGHRLIVVDALRCVGCIPNRVVRRVIVDFGFGRATLRPQGSLRLAIARTIR